MTTSRLNGAESLAEPELRDLRRLRTIVDDLPAAVYRNTPGPEGRFVEFNPYMSTMFGYSPDELRQISVADLYWERGERAALSEKVIASGIVTNELLQLKRKDGSPVWGSVTARVVKEGAASYFDGIIFDATELMSIQTITHQLLGPLASIQGHASNVKDGTYSWDRAKLAAQSIEAQSMFCAMLVRNLALLPQLLGANPQKRELEELRRQFGPVALAPLLISIAVNYQAVSRFRDISVHADARSLDVLPPVRGLDGLLRHAFSNIVDNAVKYSYEKTGVAIRGRQDGERVRVLFENYGTVLGLRDLPKLFTRGYRAQAARYIQPAGTGLGLWIARAIVLFHGGDIVPHATDAELKTVFEVVLPRA
ncbi:PAS domain-containing sensor histidine kinase [candidate division WOR-3 bacterium]|nr:PAS domain-containing sensor histidine kinase [candidate division WOR-3 bacterium]